MVVVGGTVVCGIVEGGGVVGTRMVVVAGGRVVVGSGGGGGGGGGLVVATGGCGFGVGAAVPGFRGAVVTTEARVVAVVTPGAAGAGGSPEPAVVVVVSAEIGVSGAVDVVVGRCVVVVVVRTVVRGVWLASCCLGEVSPPVATSNSRAARATEARAYSPTLKR